MQPSERVHGRRPLFPSLVPPRPGPSRTTNVVIVVRNVSYVLRRGVQEFCIALVGV